MVKVPDLTPEQLAQIIIDEAETKFYGQPNIVRHTPRKLRALFEDRCRRNPLASHTNQPTLRALNKLLAEWEPPPPPPTR